MEEQEILEFLRDNMLLFRYTFHIKTPLVVEEKTLKYLMDNIKHYLSGYGVIITHEKSLVEDTRKLGDVPEACKRCKWVKNKECWHEDSYYGQDWSDADDCFEKKS